MNSRVQNNREVLKKRQDDLSLLDFQAKYGTEDDCREYLFQIRWPNGFCCSDCEHTEYYYIRTRKVYQCKQCRKQHSLLSGTIFQDTHIPLLEESSKAKSAGAARKRLSLGSSKFGQ